MSQPLNELGRPVVPLFPQDGIRRRRSTGPPRHDVVPLPRQSRKFRAQALGITAYDVRSLERSAYVDPYLADHVSSVWALERHSCTNFADLVH
jgi:hypothetical protein